MREPISSQVWNALKEILRARSEPTPKVRFKSGILIPLVRPMPPRTHIRPLFHVTEWFEEMEVWAVTAGRGVKQNVVF